MLHDHIIAQLLAQNKEWAQVVENTDPGFFERSAQGQEPKVLWIGCSDSRVPESVITASMPGVIFTHRNIANQCHHADDNINSVLEYAVGTLKIPHIVVVGHSKCGGVAHAWATAHDEHPHRFFANWGDLIPFVKAGSALERWLAPLTAIARAQPDLSVEELGIANVRAQVLGVIKSKVVKKAWEEDQELWIHGWEYDLATGHLRDLGIAFGPEGEVAETV
ncbi:carbonic anhydrase [Obba rivulosa]|uniref:Carbonic anhydrase n=1 Tax=Obba rivulosa TaxID=1052685 RepID=A0A8E2AHI4_9APHY|nr:carbonic anhydrase [Obba rivulosa]